jgi:hypothetical protein
LIKTYGLTHPNAVFDFRERRHTDPPEAPCHTRG